MWWHCYAVPSRGKLIQADTLMGAMLMECVHDVGKDDAKLILEYHD